MHTVKISILSDVVRAFFAMPAMAKLEMLLIPNALFWSLRKCNCACALPAEVSKNCLRVKILVTRLRRRSCVYIRVYTVNNRGRPRKEKGKLSQPAINAFCNTDCD